MSAHFKSAGCKGNAGHFFLELCSAQNLIYRILGRILTVYLVSYGVTDGVSRSLAEARAEEEEARAAEA